ncbi:MAG: GNAT family N-acetyltransferase [Clostridiales bacterium]|nr:GNAT family N-acetyltransferase [Clostridiales bacterium]
MDVYKSLPAFESAHFLLRGVTMADAEDLLKVYSDEKAVPFFNGDNCHGDDFHYTTLERMKEAVKFWLFSYDNGYFVRWAIVCKETNEAIGTIELFHREDEVEDYDNCGLLRLDLRSDFEKADAITEILSLITEFVFDLFGDKVVTKVKASATERLAAVNRLGFVLPKIALKGNAGEAFDDYYVLCSGDIL